MRPLCLLLLVAFALPAAADTPSPAAALIAQGKADAAAGLNLLALADWAKAASLDPANPEVYDVRAAFYAAQQDWNRAEPDAARAALLSPTPQRCNTNGDVLTRLGRHADAARVYARALSLSLDTNKTAADYISDGMKYEAQAMPERAEACYAQALTLDSKNTDALRRSLSLWLAWNDTPNALLRAAALITVDPANAQAYADRANLYAALGRWTDALADSDNAVRLAPQDPFSWLGRGIVYSQQAQTTTANSASDARTKAAADFTHALLLDPNNVNALAARGTLFYAAGDYDKAFADLSKAIDLGVGFPPAFLFRGNIYALRHQSALALADFNRALQLDPTDPRAIAARDAALNHMGSPTH